MTPSKPAPETVERVRNALQQFRLFPYEYEVEAAILAMSDSDIKLECERRGIGFWEAGRETAAQLAETEINYYVEGMSVVDVRFSFQRGPKWKDGPAIASAIRAILPPAPGETK